MGKHTILIVDDESDIVDFTKTTLERTGRFAARGITKAEEAVSWAKQNRPDLILLDINMPVIDGGGVAQLLGDNPSTRDIPVIFLTALLRKNEMEQAGKQKHHFFLAKPVSSADLIAKIDEVLAQQP